MQIVIKGKQMEVTPQLRQHIERKVQRLSRLVDKEARVEVTVAEEKTRSARDRFSVQLALSSGSHPVHSEVSAVTAATALDLVMDKVISQLGRQKDRHTSAQRRSAPAVKMLALSRSGRLSPFKSEEQEGNEKKTTQDNGDKNKQVTSSITEERNEEIWWRVMEIRSVPTKPMDDQEAIAQMEALDLSFYPFINEATNSVNVMYRLPKGGYGLLVPTLE